MAKRSWHGTKGQKRREIMPEKTRSAAWKGMLRERLSHKQLESIFESSPDGILIYDKNEQIVRLNAAALQLFELTSPASWQGKNAQQFLQDYQLPDEQQQLVPLRPWLMNLLGDNEAGSAVPEQTLMLHLPSGRKVCVNHHYIPLFDSAKRMLGSFSIFHNITHCYHKALHVQRVHEATLALTDAVAHLPAHIDLTSAEKMLYLSPPVIFVAKTLVNVIHQVLSCRRVSLIACGPENRQFYVAGSGLTPEQEKVWCSVGGHFLPNDFVDEAVVARLSAGQEVVVTNDDVWRLHPFHSVFGAERFLLVPLFLAQQWIGTLNIVKEGTDSRYRPEEIALVKAVAAQTVLIIECLGYLEEVKVQTRALVQQEIQRISFDFLNLASHELLTPLTGIFGNIQLAQRRLETLKRRVADQSEQVGERIEYVEHPLAYASESASLQLRIINDLIDDVQIQTNQLRLRMKHCDLLTLLKEAVLKQQRLAPESPIVLKLLPTEQAVPILADAERITRVLNTYLVNALTYAPGKTPVTVELVVADDQALVSVHDEGPGISQEEQAHLWERSYRAKGSAVQHELDLSLGLGFYLCRVFIESHHGHVGVQSELGKGETFWFSLPIVPCPEG